MADTGSGGLGDLLGLFGGANPVAGISKNIAQFQKGVAEFLVTMENFNATMTQFNEVAARVNRLLDVVEEPIKTFVPQMNRTVKAADAMMEQLSGPIDKVAPGLSRLADTLSSPALTSLPRDLGEFMNVLGDLARRLQPLGQMAESAGSLFGLRPLSGLRSSPPKPERPTPPPPAASAQPDHAPPKAAKKAPVKKAGATKKAAPKRAAPSRAVVHDAPAAHSY
jgi:ABC-type transporter Mla subunit MlaD